MHSWSFCEGRWPGLWQVDLPDASSLGGEGRTTSATIPQHSPSHTDMTEPGDWQQDPIGPGEPGPGPAVQKWLKKSEINSGSMAAGCVTIQKVRGFGR